MITESFNIKAAIYVKYKAFKNARFPVLTYFNPVKMPRNLFEDKVKNCKVTGGVMVKNFVSDLGDPCSSPRHILSLLSNIEFIPYVF